MEKTIDQMLQALDNLIPGNLEPDSEPAKMLREAAGLFLNRDLQAARSKLEEAKQANPELPPADFLTAGMLFAVNNFQGGVGFLEETAKNHPEYPSTYSGFARVAINGNRITDAIALLAYMQTKIDEGQWNDLQREQFETEYLDAFIDTQTRRGNNEIAKQKLGRLAELLPEDGRVQVRMARIAFEEGLVDEAVANLETAREKTSNILVAPLIVSNWYGQKNDSQESDNWMTKASEQYPDNLDVQLNFTEWLIRKAQYSKASIWAERALQNGANSLDIASVKGRIAFVRQQFELAEMNFGKIHEEQPANIEAANMLALSLAESNNPNKLRRALDLVSVNVNAQQQPSMSSVAVLGWILFKNGDVNRAGQQLSQVARAQQKMPEEAAYFLARILVEVDRKQDALRFLNMVNLENGTMLYRSQAEELLKQLEAEGVEVDRAADQQDSDGGDGN